MEVLLARAYSYSKEASVTEVTVSSSAIRGLLQEGNVSEAAEYLGYDFFWTVRLSAAIKWGVR